MRLLMLFAASLACALAAPDLSSRDYYQVLGVARTATVKEIKSAYRKLALEFHPDKNSAADAAQTFQKIAEAYEVLSDKDARSKYDAIGKGGFGTAGGFDFKDFQRRRPGGFKHKSAAETFKEFFGDKDPFADFDKFFEDVTTTETTDASDATTGQQQRRRGKTRGTTADEARRAAAGSSSFGRGGAAGSFGSMGGGSSSFSFSFSNSRTGQKMSSETKTDKSGRRVTKTLRSDGTSTEATLEESFGGMTTRRTGTRRKQPKENEALPATSATSSAAASATSSARSSARSPSSAMSSPSDGAEPSATSAASASSGSSRAKKSADTMEYLRAKNVDTMEYLRAKNADTMEYLRAKRARRTPVKPRDEL